MEQAENPSSSRGYYCHNCNNTISLPITNFLCPDCHQGFIEKLPDGPASSSTFTERNGENRDDMDSDPVVVLNRVFDDISNNLDVIMGGGESNARNNDNRPSSSSRRETTTHPLRQNNRRGARSQPPGTFEQMLSEFLSNMSRNTQTFDGNGPVLLVGNPGDYAWGREGLDTIVTQLLNQMDSSGPPPLAKDKINQLPFVSITAQQVSENIQCSVCWDSFKMTEKVRQLPCDHIYHDLCIVPWLELHGTCPICRKLLSEDNEARLGFPHTGGLEALLSDVHRLSILQGFPRANSNRRSQIRCYLCQNLGHYARECNQRPSSANSHRRRYRGDGAGRQSANHGRSPPNRVSRQGASSTRSFSSNRHSPSRAVPTHEFLAEYGDVGEYMTDSDDCYGSDLDNFSDIVACEVCGLTSSEHHDFPCTSPDTWLQYDLGDRTTISPSWGSPVSANFAGFGGGSRHSDPPSRRVPNERKRPLTCFNCNKPGHLARDCWNRCTHCSKNHKSTDCWYAPNREPPYINGEPPHTNGEPPYINGEPPYTNGEWVDDEFSTRPGSRFQSGSLRRSDGSGPSTSRNSLRGKHENVQCFKCLQVGHIARFCPTIKEARRSLNDQCCWRCKRKGHERKNCPFRGF